MFRELRRRITIAKDKKIPANLVFCKEKFTYDNIEELKQDVGLKIGNIVELNGYYTAGDGANHKRVIANEDDGSGVQLANGLWANVVHNGEVNVSWFGAKGDGVTDDTETIQKAINYSNVSILDCNKIYCITNTVFVKSRGKTLTSFPSSERGMATIRYIGETNNKKAVIVVGINDVGEFNLDCTANVLSNLQIDANNLCGLGVYSTYCTNETRIENIITSNTLEYGMYFAKVWYATFRNLVSKNSKGNGIAFGMELRFSDRTVIKPNGEYEDIIQINNAFIDNLRAHTCGKETNSQDDKYGYGIGIGKGYSLTVTKMLSENCGIGILVKRTSGYSFKISDFYCEGNTKGFILDTRNTKEFNVLIGTISNGYIKGKFIHINGDNEKNNNGKILLENIFPTEYSRLDYNNILSLRNCGGELNYGKQPMNLAFGSTLRLKENVDLRYSGEFNTKLPLIQVSRKILYFISEKEYTNVVGSFFVKDINGSNLSSYAFPSVIKKGINFVRDIPVDSYKLDLAVTPKESIVVDLLVLGSNSTYY